MQSSNDFSSRPPRAPGGPRDSRRHTPKADMSGLYQRAIKEAFIKLDPRITVKNPVMFIVWVGTIVTTLVTIDPNLFGNAPDTGLNQRLFNGLITFILFFTLVFANFAEAVAEGRGKAQADSLRATRSDTIARKLLPDGSIQEVSSTDLRRGDHVANR
jgi:potassium-transporting ATPase ATP-binding subunit